MCFPVSRTGAVLRAAVSATIATTIGASTALGALYTGSTGGDQPFDTRQPTLDLRFAIHERGSVGEMRIFPYQSMPQQWIDATGGTFPMSGAYAALGASLGNAFGGDGVNDFAVPNLINNLPVGPGQGFGLTNRSRGEQFGAETVTLTEDQMPVHAHGYPTFGETSDAGGGQAHSTVQPSLAMRYGITTQGTFPGAPDPTAGTPDNPFIGQMRLLGGTTTPADVLEANGSQHSIALNTALFSILGTTYGGNGQSTYGLPDLRGRTPIGDGQGPGLSSRSLGELTGEENVTITENTMPSHTHLLPPEAEGGVGGQNTLPTGGSQPMENMQPSLAMTYLIRLQGVVPNFSTGMDSSSAYLGEIILFAGNFAPAGYAECAGQLLSIAQNTALFDLIGASFGGDGINTFALPDLRGRGLNGVGDVARSLGEKRGTELTTLTVGNLPSHVHEIPAPSGLGVVALAGVLAGRRRR